MSSQASEVIDGRYEVVRELGHGGFGRVALVRDRFNRAQLLALKVLNPTKGSGIAFEKRFLNEISILRNLRHEGIPQIYNDGRAGSTEIYYTMEYVAGVTLSLALADSGSMAPARIVRILRQMLVILEYAHTRGVVHRDLKPSNVMLVNAGSRSEQVRILDFGIAKLLRNRNHELDFSSLGTLPGLGTPHYMSPEQLRGKDVNEKSDVYSLGVMLYQMCSGSLPFEGGSVVAIATARLEDEPKALDDEHTPDWMKALVAKMLRRNRDERPTINEITNLLEAQVDARGTWSHSGSLKTRFLRARANSRRPRRLHFFWLAPAFLMIFVWATRDRVAGRPKLAIAYNGARGKEVEQAVLDGVVWLLRHQKADGSWSPVQLHDHCERSDGVARDNRTFKPQYDPGVTSLALISLLRAGYSPGEQRDVVDLSTHRTYHIDKALRDGLNWLLFQQNADGSFSKDHPFMYNEALCTMAMCEAFGHTRDIAWKSAAQRGVEFLQHAQRPSPDERRLWGWRYDSRMEVEHNNYGASNDAGFKQTLHDADTSVTGWCMAALTKAQLAGLTVAAESVEGGRDFVVWVTGDNGLVGYNNANAAGATVTGPGDHYTYHPASLSAIALSVRLCSESPAQVSFFDLAARQIARDLPTVSKDGVSIDYYYWYQGTLALNQYASSDQVHMNRFSGPWNIAVIDALLELQGKETLLCTHGGWTVPDRWSQDGGPIYATALGLLTLIHATR